MNTLFKLFAILFLSGSLSCVSATMKFHNVAVPPQSHTVYMLHRDNAGLMWFGSSEGLYSYDGYAPCGVFERGGVSNTHVHSMAETDSAFYLASDNGVLVFDRNTHSFRDLPEGSPRDVRAIIREGDSFLVGGLQGLFRYTPAVGSFIPITDGLPHKAVYALACDGDLFYIGTYNGMGTLRYGGTKVSPFDPGFGSSMSSRNLFVNSLFVDRRRHKLWIGTEGELYGYSIDSDKLERVASLSGNTVKSIAVTGEGTLFAGTDNGLVELRDGVVTTFRHDSRDDTSIPNNIVWALLSDCDSNLWVATDFGLSMVARGLPYTRIAIDDITGSGDGNVVQTILRESPSVLWIAGNNGLIRYDSFTSAARWYQPGNSEWRISHNSIRDLFRDRAGTLWVASDGSVSRLNERTGQFDNFIISDSLGKYNANWAYSIIDDKNGNLWIGTYLGGIFVVDRADFGSPGGNVVAKYNLTDQNGLPNNYVRRLARASDGVIYAICFANPDIVAIDPVSLATVSYRIDHAEEILPTALMPGRDGEIWIGYRGGVGRLDPRKGEVERFMFPAEYLVDPLAMEYVGDEIWVSTTAGVWKFSPSSKEFSLLRFPAIHCNAIYNDTVTGRVVLGAPDEIITVIPQRIDGGLSPVRHIYITSVTVNGEPLKGADPMRLDRLTLAHDRNYLELTVSDLDFSPDSNCRYEYRLKGSDESSFSVLEAGSNTITLPRLRPGGYTLEVRLAGDSEVLLSLPVTIRAPWYFSTLAKVVFVILLLGGIAAAIRYQVVRLRQRRERREREQVLARVKNRMDFLTNISHELKSPLSMVIGPVSHLLGQTTDPELKHHLSAIHRNAVNLDQLLHRALEINRIDKDDDTLVITSRVELVGFCRNIFDNYVENHPDKKFVFSSDIDALTVSVDVVKIESVLNNLLSNACKYSPRQSTIAFSLSSTDDRLVLRVSDDGIGIPESERPLVFQRLFRSTNATCADGTGIGLYLTKKYVEMHGGEIAVDGNGSGGSVFTISIPRASLSPAEAEGESSPEQTADSSRPTVLIVEDNPDIARFVSDLLRKDHRCIVAGNGRAGLAVLATVIPDLVIADLMMPVMSGADMISEMKRNVRYASVPVLILTAKDDPDTQRNCFEAGADAFIAKPFEAPVLLTRVKALLGSRDRIASTVKAEMLSTPRDASPESVDEKKMKEVSRLIDDNLSDSCLTVAFLADKTAMSTKQLYRLVKKYVGLSPVDLIRTMRLRKAAMLLRQRKFTVAEVMYMTGFNSASYFSKCFVAQYGMTPKSYMNTDEQE